MHLLHRITAWQPIFRPPHPLGRMILAPLAPSAKKSLEEGKKENKVDGEEEAEEHPPLISVTAKMDNATSSLDVDAKLASFACNLMVEPIKVRNGGLL